MRTAGQGSERDLAYHYRETNQRSCVLQQLEEQVQHCPVTLTSGSLWALLKTTKRNLSSKP